MAYNKEELYKQAIEEVKKHKLYFIEDLIGFLPCDKTTFYRLFDIESNEYHTIKKELEDNLNSYSHWKEFSKKVQLHAKKLKQEVFNSNQKIPAYGASARSSTLLNFCGINSNHISFIVDKNPEF